MVINTFIMIFSTHSNAACGFECNLRKSSDWKGLPDIDRIDTAVEICGKVET
jgi:hypothetical protein